MCVIKWPSLHVIVFLKIMFMLLCSFLPWCGTFLELDNFFMVFTSLVGLGMGWAQTKGWSSSHVKIPLSQKGRKELRRRRDRKERGYFLVELFMNLHFLELLQGVVESKSFLQIASMTSLVVLHVTTKLIGFIFLCLNLEARIGVLRSR